MRVFDFGYVDESLLYLAMEYVEGRTLHQVIAEEWPLGEARVVDIMSQVLSAVAVAANENVATVVAIPAERITRPTTG